MTISVVILDRDGVINEDSVDYIKSPEEWHPIPGSLEAIALLKEKGYLVYIATNQSGVGRGYYTQDGLKAIHEKMLSQVEAAGGNIDGIFFCPHTPEDQCQCRKPAPGLLLQIFAAAGVMPSDCVFVGDSHRDIEAAIAAKCAAVLVLTGNGANALKSLSNDVNVRGEVNRYENLLSFANTLHPIA